VEFFFEEISAALGIAQIFGYVATGFDMEGDATPLKRSAHIQDALAMGMIESLGNAQERAETAGDALVGVCEAGVGRVVSVRLGLPIVITDNRSDNMAIASIQAGDIAV